MWKIIKVYCILFLVTAHVEAQVSKADTLLRENLLPFLQQIRGGNYQDDFDLKIDSIFAEFPSSSYSKGLRHHMLGAFIEFKGKPDLALEHYTNAQKILGQCCSTSLDYIENDIRIGFISIHSGLLNFDTVYFQKGYKYVVEGYDRAKKNGFTETAQRMLDFMGDYHYYSAFRIEDFDQALIYYEQLYKELEGSPDSTYRYIDSRLNLANVHRRLNNAELSESYFDEAIELARKYNYQRIIYSAYNDLAEIFENNGNYEKALELKLLSYESAIQVADKEILNRANRQLYQTYKNLGDQKNALKYLELHLEGVRDMNKAEALQMQAKIESQQEVERKQLEIVSLQNKNLANSRKFLVALAGLSALIFGILAYAYRKQLATNKTLKQKNKEILMAQMKGQNMERKRMAGELHDNLNTKIAAVRYRLEAQSLKNEKDEMLEGTISLINDIYEDIRLISHNLIPETVEELGLVPSLQKLFNTLNENDGTIFHLVSNIKSEDPLSSISYELYNIIFEMVNNILKHSEASNAWISISLLQAKVLLTVRDDGTGFDVAENHGGFGLKSINSRVEKLGGKYSIKSSKGSGTTYTLEIPLLD